MGAGYLLPLMDVAATSICSISQVHLKCLTHGSILHIVVLVVPTVMAINPIATTLHIEVRSSVDSPFLPSQQFIVPCLHTIEVSIASTFKGIIGYLELLARENSLPESVASEVLIWIVPVFL